MFDSSFYLILVLKIVTINNIIDSVISILRIENYSISTKGPFNHYGFHFSPVTLKKYTVQDILKLTSFLRLLICIMLFALNIQKSTILLLISIFLFLYNFFFLSYFRLYSDTSDKLQFFTLIGLIIGFSFSNYWGILFIASNVLMIYFFTGFNKIKSKPWQNGSAIFMVMNIETYGNKVIAEFLYKKKCIQKIISWLIILFQLSFPLCLINKKVCLAYLALGFAFHLANMIVMKLHNFFWLFIATYPCIYYVSLKMSLF